jgi:hypothetical protein
MFHESMVQENHTLWTSEFYVHPNCVVTSQQMWGHVTELLIWPGINHMTTQADQFLSILLNDTVNCWEFMA